MKIVVTALLITLSMTAAFASEKLDFIAAKNHGKNISSWLNKIRDTKTKMAPQEIITTAYARSDSGSMPYESMNALSKFYDQCATDVSSSTNPEDKAYAEKLKELNQRLKRMTKSLETAKKADSSTVRESLDTSYAYGQLLKLQKDSPGADLNFDEVIIAASNRAHTKTQAAGGGSAVEGPRAGVR